jgi:DNA polymerase-1
MVTKKTGQKRLVLLDSHAIIHRAYHALPEFVSSKGEPTGGLFGLATMLIRIAQDLKPDYLVACYDLPDPTFRRQIYEGYKAGRQKADDGLVAQLIRSRDVFTAFNIPIYDRPGFEADDVLGTIVEKLYPRSGGNQGDTLSTDFQGVALVTKGADLQIVIASGDLDTLQLVVDDQVVVYTLKRGLSDTITYNEAAVRERFGFGPELLPDWKGLRGDPSDNIIGIKGIGEKTATILISQFGSIEEIYKKLKKNKKIFLEAGIKERIIKLLTENEEEALFSKTLATIRRDVPLDFKLPEKAWREGLQFEPIEKLFTELDFRTLGARVKNALFDEKENQGVALKDAQGDALIFLDPETAIAIWLLNSELTDPKPEDVKFSKEELLEQIKEKNLEQVYQEIELPLIPIIAEAEKRGILVDREKMEKLSAEYHGELTKLEKKIYESAGAEFNLNSPKQLGEILFDKMNLVVKGLKKTAGGARSTRESELVKLKDVHPVIAEILRYREWQKLVSTYLDAIPKLLDENNRLHTHLHQTGTTTGRMSSSEPNLQNIPADEIHGDKIRAAFIASPGHRWLSFDYSQIEMRVLALLSGDEELIRIFKSGSDVHTSVAVKVFRVTESEVTREMRRKAKVINFGIIYGMGVSALQKNLNSTRAEAQEFYDQYFIAFPKINAYFEKVKAEAKAKGYTETYFGRRRYFSGLKAKLSYIVAMNERMAMNAPLQGTAADIVKIAMRKVDEEIKKNNWKNRVHLLLQVHDELIYEVEDKLVAEVKPVIEKIMENAVSASIPFTVTASEGKNWGEAE